MMSKKELVPNRQYTDEFKLEAVRLGESIGGNQAAKRLDIPESSLWNWIKLSRAGKLKAGDGKAVLAKRSVGGSRGGERAAAPRAGEHQAGS
jgi:transposase